MMIIMWQANKFSMQKHNINVLDHSFVCLYMFTEQYLVQLISTSNATILPAPYIVHVQSNKITGYTALGTKQVAWVWNAGDFFAYRLKKKIVPEVEMIIGT